MIFCNSLAFNKIRIWLVRGPLSHPSPPDSSQLLGMTFLVILNGAGGEEEGSGGGVKDLECHSGFLHQIPRSRSE